MLVPAAPGALGPVEAVAAEVERVAELDPLESSPDPQPARVMATATPTATIADVERKARTNPLQTIDGTLRERIRAIPRAHRGRRVLGTAAPGSLPVNERRSWDHESPPESSTRET